MKKTFNKRKFKYGSLATAITALFIAAVILLNILASQMTERFGLKLDMTEEQLFEVSQQTIDYLQTLQDDVEIAIMVSEETLDSGSLYYKMVKEIAEKYTQNSDKIKLSYYDTEKNPDVVNKYSQYYTGTISMGNIVVFCDGRIKVLTMYDLFEMSMDYTTYQQTITDIKAEQAFTSAVMFVADPNPPTVAILSCQESESVSAALADLNQILTDNGYEVDTVDLLNQDIDSKYSMVILPAPSTDLTDTAIEKIDNYLYNDGNLGKNLFYLANFDQRETPKLDVFLEEWGIKVGTGYVTNINASETIRVGIQGLGNYYSVPQAIIADEDSKAFVNSESIPMVMPMSRPIELLFDTDDDRETKVILKTADSSIIADETTNESNVNDIAQSAQNVLVSGSKHIFEGEDKISSNVIVSGSAYFLDSYITSTNGLNNLEFSLNLINEYTGKNGGINIIPKSLTVESINITDAVSRSITIVVVVIFPLIVVGIGIVVFLRRRNR